jgi:hypothetical protein
VSGRTDSGLGLDRWSYHDVGAADRSGLLRSQRSARTVDYFVSFSRSMRMAKINGNSGSVFPVRSRL